MQKILLIAIGGAVGSALRYLVAGWVQRGSGSGFPYGTLAVNVAGCFLIASLNFMLLGPVLLRPELRLALIVGLLGGFTTFSSFGWETLALANDGAWGAALANVLLNNVGGLFAAWLAYHLTEAWLGP
jgi:fluoride exporter